MKSLRYLNTVLTVIAVLLTVNLYVQLTTGPAPWGADEARATVADGLAARGVGSQAQRQQDILEEIKAMSAAATAINASLTNGSVRVRVDAMPQDQ